jgi:metal-responsive CopG/Arc/MetJ family transcriptional regulator
MATIKTAVSLHEQLFKQAEVMARELKLSRSRLFAAALEEFIERHRNRQLLDRINKAYEATDDSERKYLRKMRQRHRKSIEGEW